jgi:hypothetical protein
MELRNRLRVHGQNREPDIVDVDDGVAGAALETHRRALSPPSRGLRFRGSDVRRLSCRNQASTETTS